MAAFGLAFKPDIDDLRESPAVEIVKDLAPRFTRPILAVEPNIAALPPALSACGVELIDGFAALDQADVWTLLVDHRPFKTVSPKRRDGVEIVDARGIWTD